MPSPISAEDGGEEVKKLRLVAKLLDVWGGLDTTPEQVEEEDNEEVKEGEGEEQKEEEKEKGEEEEEEEEEEEVKYALYQEDGEVLTTKVYPDHSVDLPLRGRQSVVMMLGRRYVTGVGHDQDHHGEVLLLRKRESGTYVRIVFATLLFEGFEEKWEPRFKVETIVLA